MDELADRIAGGLAGALLGDAMGSVTEQLTPRQIEARYGVVTTLLAPAEGTFASGRIAGELTDDGLLTLAVVDGLLAHHGDMTADQMAALLVEWAKDPELFGRFAGPSSRRAIVLLQQGATPVQAGAPDPMANDFRTSNGAAMKVAPAGWINPGRSAAAVRLAGRLCVPTHNSDIAFAGAGAVAAAASSAASGAGRAAVFESAVRGAEAGATLGLEQAVEVPGPSIVTRLELALDVATSGRSTGHRIRRLAGIFSNGLPIAEAVPMAVGMCAVIADPMELIRTIVNLGNDADTVASIAGGLAGTITGVDGFDRAMITQLEQVNDISLQSIADRLAAATDGGAP